MARRRRYKGLGFNNKSAITIVYIIIVLGLLQHIDVLIGLMSSVVAIAALYFYFRWYAKELARGKILELGIKEIDAMQGTDFKNYLGVLFENMGYTVKFTPASGDYGENLLLEKGGIRISVQAKRYKSTVGVKAIQEANSAKGFYSTNEAWVVTNNTFTKNAYNLAERNGVKLVDRGQLINFITNSNAKIPSAK
jgi:restriction system protein